LGKTFKLGEKIELSPTFYLSHIVVGFIIGKEYEINSTFKSESKKDEEKKKFN